MLLNLTRYARTTQGVSARSGANLGARSRLFSSTLRPQRPYLEPVPILSDSSLETFQRDAFKPAVPALLPQKTFASSIPAVTKWFLNNEQLLNDELGKHDSKTSNPLLNIEYLDQFGDTAVPLELTTTSSTQSHFTRTEAPLSTFLSYISALQSDPTLTATPTRIYLAQCPLSTLPSTLQNDLPPPPYLKAGKGDVYDSSIWLGLAPTHTPLHRDPNPNLFVQLAGRKVVHVFSPAVGAELFAEAGRKIPGARGMGMGLGEEMMVGEGRRALDELVWGEKLAVRHGESGMDQDGSAIGYEAVLDAGDIIHIPKGWWHSVKGVGSGIIGSVNWWFR